MTGNLDMPAEDWLKELFECEYCAECGGDERHHTAIPFLGNWFAYCNYPMPEGSEEFHPVIAAVRDKED